MTPGVYSLLAEHIREKRPVALATAISGARPGAKLLVPGDGPTVGSVHHELDQRLAAEARDLLVHSRNETRAYELEGERIEVFIEVFPPPERLFIVGAVHIAIPLHRLGKLLGYNVTVVDPRGALANEQRFPLADAVLVEWPDDALISAGLDASSSLVVLTHDARFDIPALLVGLRSNARYVGAIGSLTTNTERVGALRREGLSEEQIGSLYAPVGLDIGAQTPAEIALAIMSEIVAVKHNRTGSHLRSQKGTAR